ncbi:Uncharacterised protein [Bordetella pertussis]|nr:Uncharacterised protein [Bordetella pertussis]
MANKALSPGPPSFSYLRSGEHPSTWQKSSCGRRISHCPLGATRRSNRSTTSTRCCPKVAMLASATSNPYAFSSFRHSHSLSTEVLKSARRPPTKPNGSLKIWLVDVAPRGASHCPPHHRKAVFSCAPAREILKSASGSRPAAKARGVTVSIKCRSMSSSDRGTPSMRSKPSGISSSSRICTAPTQSRPMAFNRSKGSTEPVLNRSATRRRIASLSGSRLSK